MISQPTLPDLFDWQPLQPDAIELTPDQVDRAIVLSQSITDPNQQWQRYLDALALVGFEQWLGDRAPDLNFQQTDTPLSPSGPSSGVWNLQVGPFSVGLLTIGSLSDAVVSVPAAALPTGPSPAHRVPQFYVLLEVLEEQELVRVYGYLRSDQLQHQTAAAPLNPNADGNYDLPLRWFAPDPDTLLLLLRVLDAAAIPTVQTTPAASTVEPAAASTAAAVTQAPPPAPVAPVPSPSRPRAQPLINAARWLQNQLDTVAEELAWVLLPPMPVGAMRWRNQEMQDLTAALQDRGVQISPAASGAYADLFPKNIPLRLHSLIWELPDNAEWVLLVVLGPQPGFLLPPGVRLRIRDEQQVLTDQALTADNPDGYVYAQVVGAVGESFGITIELPDGTNVNLPLLTFAL